MEQKVLKKIEFYGKIVPRTCAGSSLIIVPGSGAKKQGFRGKQIVPKIGVEFWYNRVKSVINGTSKGIMVPNLKPLKSRVIASNTADFKITNKSRISSSIPANLGDIRSNTPKFASRKPIRANLDVSEANTYKFTEKQVKLTAFLKPPNSGVIASNTAEFERALICERSTSQRLIRDYAECMSKK